MRTSPCTGVGLAVALSLFAPSAAAQTQELPSYEVDYFHDTGEVRSESAVPEVVISFPVRVQGAQWLRLAFADIELAGDVLAGEGSILRITSLLDASVQELNKIHVQQWRNTSAYFNGDTVLVEVLAQPGTGANRVVLSSVTVGELPQLPETICGPVDDRVLSSEPANARMLPIGCTGWMIDDCNTCFLSAGHCAGGLTTAQFNVPLSTSGGGLVHPGPEDQYSVDGSSLQSENGGALGTDWAYYGVFPNSNTGLTPFQAQGDRYTLANPPGSPGGNTIRITGYGTDSTPSTHNQVQQTHTGPMATAQPSLLQYETDTTGGNSGSPVFWIEGNAAIGIHTNGGCSSSGGANSGTGVLNGNLQNALGDPQGVCAAGANPVALPTTVPLGVPTNVDVQVNGTSVAGSTTLHWRINGGSYTAQVMNDLGGGLFRGTLPGAACDDAIEFYFSTQNSTCGTIVSPATAPATGYSALVGDLVTVLADDFESDAGWTPTNLGASSGDWQRGVPVNDGGWAYDPVSDSDGSGQCWLTQNQVGNTDVDNGSVRLTSVAYDLSSGDHAISYDYFLRLTNSDGTDALVVEIDSNGGFGPWTEIARHDTDGGLAWRTHTIGQSALNAAGVTMSSAMVLRWTANDTGTQSIVEAGLDAFTIERVDCDDGPQNYCTPGVTTNFCTATMFGTGTPSASAGSGYQVGATGVEGQKSAIIFYGVTGPLSTPWGSSQSFLCVKSPRQRTGGATTDGTAGSCDGDVSIDFNAFVQQPGKLGVPFSAGDTVWAQCWFRDPPSIETTNLSDGLQFTMQP